MQGVSTVLLKIKLLLCVDENFKANTWLPGFLAKGQSRQWEQGLQEAEICFCDSVLCILPQSPPCPWCPPWSLQPLSCSPPWGSSGPWAWPLCVSPLLTLYPSPPLKTRLPWGPQIKGSRCGGPCRYHGAASVGRSLEQTCASVDGFL